MFAIAPREHPPLWFSARFFTVISPPPLFGPLKPRRCNLTPPSFFSASSMLQHKSSSPSLSALTRHVSLWDRVQVVSPFCSHTKPPSAPHNTHVTQEPTTSPRVHFKGHLFSLLLPVWSPPFFVPANTPTIRVPRPLLLQVSTLSSPLSSIPGVNSCFTRLEWITEFFYMPLPSGTRGLNPSSLLLYFPLKPPPIPLSHAPTNPDLPPPDDPAATTPASTSPPPPIPYHLLPSRRFSRPH